MNSCLPFTLLFLLTVFSSARPNILYINADDLGYTDLGCYGGTYYETPHLDALAQSGILFTDGYAAAANCAPSRVCAMTGQWGARHGVYTVGSSERGESKERKLIPIKNKWYAPQDALLLPALLQESGYVTAHFGKWHVNKEVLKSGFHENYGGFHGGSPTYGGYHAPFNYPGLKSVSDDEYLTDRLALEGVNFIKRHAESDAPFFMHFTTYTVHSPIQPREDLLKYYKNKKGNTHHHNPHYAAMVHCLDEAVGRLVKALEETGIREKTLIIFTSDNGGIENVTDNHPLRGEKGAYYEGGIREPFIWNWEGTFTPRVDSTVISQLDLFPTLCAVAGSDIPNGATLDGVDLTPLLLHQTPLKERALYWHFPVYLQASSVNSEIRDPLFRTRPGSVIRAGKWKLHEYFEDQALELYDLSADLSESKNLAASNPEKTAELHSRLKEWRTMTGAAVPTVLNPEFKGNDEASVKE